MGKGWHNTMNLDQQYKVLNCKQFFSQMVLARQLNYEKSMKSGMLVAPTVFIAHTQLSTSHLSCVFGHGLRLHRFGYCETILIYTFI